MAAVATGNLREGSSLQIRCFGDEMQTMDGGLTQRNGCVAAVFVSRVAARIAEKWWRRHMNDYNGGASRAPSIELRGESPGLTRVGYTWQWRHSYVVTLLKALLGYARTVSSG
uniref:Uncharacterized protein n=1 Tax=Aegilops tauschii subsp. strangulata TaxID=200361 RepID=A0A452Z0F5_AEGTS